MRSLTALALLLALICVLDSEAKGTHIGKGSPQARKLCEDKKDKDEEDDLKIARDKGSLKASQDKVDAGLKRAGDQGNRKAPKGSRKLKSECTPSVVSQAPTKSPTPPALAALATGNGCDKQASITAALAIIAGSSIWFAM